MKANRLIIALLLLIPPVSYYFVEKHFAEDALAYSIEAPLKADKLAAGQVRILLKKVVGLRVLHMQPRSLLNSLGLKVGDLIFQVNGLKITQVSELEKSLKEHLSGKALYLEYYRGKELLKVIRSK